MRTHLISVAGLVLANLLGRPARSEILYDADRLPGQATCPDGEISWFMDLEQGQVIRAHVRDVTGKNSERCEFATPQGLTQLGQTIYVGWRSRIDAPLTGGWNGIYQMKCHGMHVADQPLNLDMRNGRLTLSNHEDVGGQETARTVWSTELPRNQWFSIVLKVHYSESRTEGTVEIWWNGVKQTLANGTTIHTGQTWDGSDNNMHWGIYRANEVTGDGYHYIWRPRVATTYGEAAPEGDPEPPSPDAGTATGDAPAGAGGASATGGSGGMGGAGGPSATGGVGGSADVIARDARPETGPEGTGSPSIPMPRRPDPLPAPDPGGPPAPGCGCRLDHRASAAESGWLLLVSLAIFRFVRSRSRRQARVSRDDERSRRRRQIEHFWH
jgi:hypothetical protein